MPRKKMEEKNELDFNTSVDIEVDTNTQEELVELPRMKSIERPSTTAAAPEKLINCLKNERIIVRHINKKTGMIKDPKHVLYGGMAENAKRTFTVPLLRSGAFTDVLTKNEKNFLEYALGLEANALSVYKKEDNFWSTANPQGISSVILTKQDNYFDLSNPVDYIKVKILLANKDRIAPSIQVLQDTPKATYEFVMIAEKDSAKMATQRTSIRKNAYKALGKIEDNYDVLRFVVETVDGRPVADNTNIETLQVKADELIQSNASIFLRTIEDELLDCKVLIRKAISTGIIAKRGNYHYLLPDNMPLCNNNQEPTLSVAAAFLSEPKHQEIKFNIEARLKNLR